MTKRTIVALPGDGIGKTVLEEAIRVLGAAGFEAEYVEGDIGWEFWKKEGNPLPERTIKLIITSGTCLFLIMTTHLWSETQSYLIYLFSEYLCTSTSNI